MSNPKSLLERREDILEDRIVVLHAVVQVDVDHLIGQMVHLFLVEVLSTKIAPQYLIKEVELIHRKRDVDVEFLALGQLHEQTGDHHPEQTAVCLSTQTG